jgi:hypothetical protein
MKTTTVISKRRNIAIGSGVVALVVMAFGCSYFFDQGDTSENVVKVITTDDKRPRMGFEDTLPPDVTGVILVSPGKSETDKPTITAVSRKGELINLCGSKTECNLDTTPDALTERVARINKDQGTCYFNDEAKSCHKTGTNKDKWKWHRSPDSGRHKKCQNDEGCQ